MVLLWKRASLAPQTVKNLPAMQETQVHSLEWGRSPGEGHGYPLQYSCLENPMDRGAWWAIVEEVTELDMTEWLSLSLDWKRGGSCISDNDDHQGADWSILRIMQTLSPPSRDGERKGKVISFCWEVWCEASSWRCWCFCCFWDPVRALLAK